MRGQFDARPHVRKRAFSRMPLQSRSPTCFACRALVPLASLLRPSSQEMRVGNLRRVPSFMHQLARLGGSPGLCTSLWRSRPLAIRQYWGPSISSLGAILGNLWGHLVGSLGAIRQSRGHFIGRLGATFMGSPGATRQSCGHLIGKLGALFISNLGAISSRGHLIGSLGAIRRSWDPSGDVRIAGRPSSDCSRIEKTRRVSACATAGLSFASATLSDAKAFSLTSVQVSGWKRQRGVSASATAGPSARFFDTWSMTAAWLKLGCCASAKIPWLLAVTMAASSGDDIPTQLAALLGGRTVQIRKTNESPPRISVIDVVEAITGQVKSNAGKR